MLMSNHIREKTLLWRKK